MVAKGFDSLERRQTSVGYLLLEQGSGVGRIYRLLLGLFVHQSLEETQVVGFVLKLSVNVNN